MLVKVYLKASLFSALYFACSGLATPLPPNAIAGLPSDFILAPLITPPAPASASDITTDSHIVRDSYLVILQDHLEPHEVSRHHSHVKMLHAADERVRHLKASSAVTSAAVVPTGLDGIVHEFSIGKKARSKKVHGYSGKFSESTLDAIRALPDVKFVERDSIVWAFEVEKGAPWVSHPSPPPSHRLSRSTAVERSGPRDNADSVASSV